MATIHRRENVLKGCVLARCRFVYRELRLRCLTSVRLTTVLTRSTGRLAAVSLYARLLYVNVAKRCR